MMHKFHSQINVIVVNKWSSGSTQSVGVRQQNFTNDTPRTASNYTSAYVTHSVTQARF